MADQRCVDVVTTKFELKPKPGVAPDGAEGCIAWELAHEGKTKLKYVMPYFDTARLQGTACSRLRVVGSTLGVSRSGLFCFIDCNEMLLHLYLDAYIASVARLRLEDQTTLRTTLSTSQASRLITSIETVANAIVDLSFKYDP